MTNDVIELVSKYLALSDTLRPGYTESLGQAASVGVRGLRERVGELPAIVEGLYGSVSGTRRDIKDQALFDFIPGSRLIHIDELAERLSAVSLIAGRASEQHPEVQNGVFPFLVDYSDHFICVGLRSSPAPIISIGPDEEPAVMSTNELAYLQMLIACYEDQVFFLDEDGYLDYDFEKECEVGRRFNPEVDYWVADEH